MRTFPSCLPFLLSAAICAQEPVSALRFVPADAAVVVRCAGPGAWRTQFEKTRVVKLLHGPTLGPLLQKLADGRDQAMAAARASGKVDADVLERAVKDYAGEIAIGVTVDFTDIGKTIEDRTPPPFGVVIAFGPDGKTDLKTLANDALKAAEQEGGLTDLKVGEHTLRVHAEKGIEVALPFELDGHFVVMFGSRLEQQAAALFAGKDRFEAPPVTLQGPLAVHVAAERGLGALLDAVAKMAEDHGAPFDVGPLLTSLGLRCVRGLDLVLGADGEHVAAEMRLAFNDKERGLAAALTPPSKSPPVTLAYVPTGLEAFSITPLDFGVIYRVVAGVWDQLGDQVPMSRGDAEAAFADACKVRLKEDLFDHLGTELVGMGDETAGEPDEDAEDPLSAAMSAMKGCFAVHLKDGKAFAESVEKLIRARGLHAGRKSEEYQGTKVSRLNLGGFELEYALTTDLLVVALGKDESGRKNLRGILDECAARAAGKERAELAEDVKARLARMPAGWHGVGATPPHMLLDSLLGGMRGAAETGNVPFDEEDIAAIEAAIAKVRGELQQFHLGTVVSTQHIEASALVYRLRW